MTDDGCWLQRSRLWLFPSPPAHSAVRLARHPGVKLVRHDRDPTMLGIGQAGTGFGMAAVGCGTMADGSGADKTAMI